MFHSSGRGRLAAVCSLAAGLFLAAPALSQETDDLLKDVQARQEVAAQKREAEVQEAKREAKRLYESNPAKALDLLKSALNRVRNDSDLPSARRDALVKSLQYQIDNYEKFAARRTDRSFDPPPRRPDVSRREDGTRGIFEGLARVHKERGDAVGEARRGREDSKTGYLGVMRSLDKSNVPPNGDIEFPADWREKTLKRSTASKLTDKERAILKALSSPISVEFKSKTFQSVMDFLQEAMGQPIILDKRGMDEVGVTYETPVNLNLRNVATRTVLKRILADYGLTYVIKEEAIQITSIERAKDMLITRSYPIADLAGIGNVSFAPGVNQFQAAQNIKAIIDLIQSSIEPSSWQVNNGPGTIVFEPTTMSLIVKASAEVHYALGGYR
jgi:hypothetical protein